MDGGGYGLDKGKSVHSTSMNKVVKPSSSVCVPQAEQHIEGGRSVVLALRAETTTPKSIKKVRTRRISKEKKIAETLKQSNFTMMSQTGDDNNLVMKQLDPEVGCTETQMEKDCPQLIDYLSMLNPEDVGSSSANNFTNPGLMEQREMVPTLNLDLTLNCDGVDLTLRL